MAAATASSVPIFDGDASPDAKSEEIDDERFVPLTPEELDAELDLIEAAEEQDEAEETGNADADVDPTEEKLRQVQVLRDRDDEGGARRLLYEVLAEGTEQQVMVARNILEQLDQA